MARKRMEVKTMATISNLNFNNMIRKEAQRIGSMDETLGTGLMQPNNATNSSSRKLMFNQHLAQSIPIKGAERPLIATGYENEFGRDTSKESDKEFLENHKTWIKNNRDESRHCW